MGIHLRANGIDFLPDFVGYILIAAGVSGLPDRNVKFISARNLPLQLLSIGNIAALLLFLAFLFITRTKYLEFCTRRKYMNKTDCP